MKVSIITAVYNAEKTIGNTIDSILSQTYKNIRLIISDDASKDNTVEIIKEYQKKDNRIILYEQEKNLGYIKNFEFF